MNNDALVVERTETGRRVRRDKGLKKFTPRDALILQFIGEMYAIRLDQLQYLLARESVRNDIGSKNKIISAESLAESSSPRVTYAAAMRTIDRWIQLGLVEYKKVFQNEPGWIWLTPKGLRELGFNYRASNPSMRMLEHYYWVNQVRFYCENRPDYQSWKCERQIRFEEPNLIHYPDGELTIAQDKLIAIEVELTQKEKERLIEIVKLLNGQSVNGKEMPRQYRGVFYYVTDAVEKVLENSIAVSELDSAGNPRGKDKSKFRVKNLKEIIV